MTVKNLIKSKKSGSVLSMALIAVIIVTIMGLGILTLGMNSRLFAVYNTSGIKARGAADAGLVEALFLMNKKLDVKPWSDTDLPKAEKQALPYTNANYTYSVADDVNNTYYVESSGASGRSNKKVSCNLKLKGLFEYAIFTREGISLRNGTQVDGYNYNSAGETLQIGTQSIKSGAIDAKLGVTIDGDVVVGVDGNPDTVVNTKSEVTITGDTYAAFEEYEFMSVTVPSSIMALPSQGIMTNGTTLLNSAKYGGIKVGNSEIITIDGNVTLYVMGDMILDNSAQLRIADPNINPDASLTLYLGGNLILKNGGYINNLAKDPQKLKLYALDSCTNINFITASKFYGAIYAPQADIRIHNSVEIYGSMIANSFIQDVAGSLHYDASLRQVSPDEVGVRFVVTNWREY